MFVYGGKGTNANRVLDLEIYVTNSSEWFAYKCDSRHRHGFWLTDTCLHIFGGFEKGLTIPTNTIQVIDLAKMFIDEEHILKVILEHVIVKNCVSQKQRKPIQINDLSPPMLAKFVVE